MPLRFFRQVQFYLVYCCAGLFHVCDLWSRDIWKTTNRASESIDGDCRGTRRSRIARVVDGLSPTSEAARPGVFRPAFANVVALRIHVYRWGYRLLMVLMLSCQSR